MEFSYNQRSTFSNIGNPIIFYADTQAVNSENFANNFNHFLKVDLTEKRIEVPIFMRTLVANVIFNNKISCKYNQAIYPLFSNRVSTRSTFDSVIKTFFTSVSLLDRLCKNVSKGDIFYGTRGLVLDKDFNILFLCTLMYDYIQGEDIGYLDFDKLNIYINPSVFLDNKETIPKGIINKLIPYYVSHDINVREEYSRRNKIIKPQILIEDVTNRFIVSPTKPVPGITSNDSINEFLINHIDNILDDC
jgi:hypothetical protein